jgi:hypothetical protein
MLFHDHWRHMIEAQFVSKETIPPIGRARKFAMEPAFLQQHTPYLPLHPNQFEQYCRRACVL